MLRAVALAVLAVSFAHAQPARAETDDKERKKQEKQLLNGDVEERRRAASFFWSNANEGSVAVLVEALHDEDLWVRSGAAGALWKLGEKARPAEGPLRQALTDPSARVRLKAAGALEALGTPPEQMAEAVAMGLEDSDVGVRADAAHYLKRAGAPAVRFLPVLLSCVRESQKNDATDSRRLSETQSQCRKDLRTLGVLPKDAMPILDDALKEGDKEERRAAAEAIGKAGGAGRAEIPALASALKDPERDVRLAAADGLGSLGNAAREAIPALTEVLRSDPDADVRNTARRALEEIGPDAPRPVSN
ncbi:MAG: HEAT repeat domain-containing protein [Acidobacteriota bacterium]